MVSFCNYNRDMPEREWTTPECPVGRAADLVGDRWSLLIVRDAFDGVRRFRDFQRSLGIARSMLTVRLRRLVEIGILANAPASDGSRYDEYVLTEQGRALFPVIVGLRQWGERYAFAQGERHSVLVDRETGRRVPRMSWRTDAGRAIAPDEVRVREVA